MSKMCEGEECGDPSGEKRGAAQTINLITQLSIAVTTITSNSV